MKDHSAANAEIQACPNVLSPYREAISLSSLLIAIPSRPRLLIAEEPANCWDLAGENGKGHRGGNAGQASFYCKLSTSRFPYGMETDAPPTFQTWPLIS